MGECGSLASASTAASAEEETLIGVSLPEGSSGAPVAVCGGLPAKAAVVTPEP